MPASSPSDDRARQARFSRAVLALMLIGFLAIFGVAVAAVAVLRQEQNETSWLVHSYEVERQASAIRLGIEVMRSSRRGIILQLGPTMRPNYERGAGQLRSAIAAVARLTADNPDQQRRVQRMAVLADQFDRMMRGSMRPDLDRSPAAERPRQAVARATVAASDDLLAAERRLLAQRSAARASSERLFLVILPIAGVLLLLVAAGSIWVIRRYTLDLGASRDALRALNANLEDAVRERTIDLQRANEEIQRFAYIVSHDLRSPLVNVMGFTAELEAATRALAALIDRAEAEAPALVTTAARDAAREDLPEAIGFIRTSTQKMDRLINAILRLSREGRRTINAEPIDMAALANGVVATLRHRLDELGAEVSIPPTLPGIVSDRLAIEQILSNIVENAVKYLKPGRPGRIAIAGRREGARAIFEVSDNGRGIDPRDHERVFDLFRRSGTQDQPGEGIGLAHVRAQAYRIGGTIAVESALDRGATFRINLPAVFAGERGAAE